jgi:L-amino acid N-acyltransferase YncA
MVSALIRAAGQADAAGIANIYNHYIANTVVTFDENTVAVDWCGLLAGKTG